MEIMKVFLTVFANCIPYSQNKIFIGKDWTDAIFDIFLLLQFQEHV